MFEDFLKSRKRKMNFFNTNISFLIVMIVILSLPFFAVINDDSHKLFKDEKNHIWVVKKDKYDSICNDSLFVEPSPQLMDFRVVCRKE